VNGAENGVTPLLVREGCHGGWCERKLRRGEWFPWLKRCRNVVVVCVNDGRRGGAISGVVAASMRRRWCFPFCMELDICNVFHQCLRRAGANSTCK